MKELFEELLKNQKMIQNGISDGYSKISGDLTNNFAIHSYGKFDSRSKNFILPILYLIN